MSEKTRDIIDILLCGLYMAVLRMPVAYAYGYAEYKFAIDPSATGLFITTVIISVISGYAMISDKASIAAVKWIIANILTYGSHFLLCWAFNNTYFVNNYVGGTLIIITLFMVISDFIAFVYSGESPIKAKYAVNGLQMIKSKYRTSKTAYKIQKLVCPIVCGVIVILLIVLVCIRHFG
ncbi:MAG: hypothetical protein E7485_05250 [Ruminococcaceae bacterium]|nr:hypothetical protein [Oscillospiraceae bacterium]